MACAVYQQSSLPPPAHGSHQRRRRIRSEAAEPARRSKCSPRQSRPPPRRRHTHQEPSCTARADPRPRSTGQRASDTVGAAGAASAPASACTFCPGRSWCAAARPRSAAAGRALHAARRARSPAHPPGRRRAAGAGCRRGSSGPPAGPRAAPPRPAHRPAAHNCACPPAGDAVTQAAVRAGVGVERGEQVRAQGGGRLGQFRSARRRRRRPRDGRRRAARVRRGRRSRWRRLRHRRSRRAPLISQFCPRRPPCCSQPLLRRRAVRRAGAAHRALGAGSADRHLLLRLPAAPGGQEE